MTSSYFKTVIEIMYFMNKTDVIIEYKLDIIP